MTFKLKTSKRTMDIFKNMEASQNLQPFALSKLAIALSIKRGALSDIEYKTDNEGLEMNRQTIFGEYDLLFRTLVEMVDKRNIAEDNYFPKMVKAHLDRGAILLENEDKYSKEFYNYLCNLDAGI